MLSHILTSGGMILLPAAGAKTVGPSAAVVMATKDITCSDTGSCFAQAIHACCMAVWA